jgi:PKD repeat protein
MKKILAGILCLTVILVLVSCSSSSSATSGPDKYGSSGENQQFRPTLTPAPTTSKPLATRTTTIGLDNSGGYTTDGAIPEDRMIVRTGYLSMVVEDVGTAIDKITALTESGNGYVVSSNSWKEGERLKGTISIRVPAGDFTNIMQAITNLAVEVTSQNTSSQDVTEEYVDLTAKLGTLEATEQQLLAIMQKAEKVEDVLAVQRELTNTRTQIEQTKGRMQYLEKTSATSLIEVTLEQSKLDATFTADRRFIKSGESIQFNPVVAGGFSPYSYQWDFGDGKTSNEMIPQHVFRGSGDYAVTLVVTDDRGNSATETMKDYIRVAAGWSAGNIAGNAWNGLAGFGRWLASAGIWLGIFSPVWLIIGGFIFWMVRRSSKKKA